MLSLLLSASVFDLRILEREFSILIETTKSYEKKLENAFEIQQRGRE